VVHVFDCVLVSVLGEGKFFVVVNFDVEFGAIDGFFAPEVAYGLGAEKGAMEVDLAN